MLEINTVYAGYGGSSVLNGASLSFKAGEVVGLAGYNGMGKTTLLRTVMGVLPVKAGVIRWDGQEIHQMLVHKRARQGISFVKQGCSGFPKLSVLENLNLAAYADPSNGRRNFEKVLAKMPRLERLLKRPSGALSGGERQLLALARALISSPKLLLIDEITDGIQPSICDELGELLASIRNSEGVSMLVVDQDLRFLAKLVDRAFVMNKGEIAGERTPLELTSDTPFVFN